MTTFTFQSRLRAAAPRRPTLQSHAPALNYSEPHRYTRFFRWVSDWLGRLLGIPLPSGRLNLNFWTVNPRRLDRYEAHVPSLVRSRASWFTLLYWQNLLDEYRPEPWASAIIEVDLREAVEV